MSKTARVVVDVKGATDEKRPHEVRPLFVEDANEEGDRLEIWRLRPAPAFVADGDPSWTAEDLRDFVRGEDTKWGREGATYRAVLKRSDGTYKASTRVSVLRDPTLPAQANGGAAGGAGMPDSILTTIVATLDAGNRSYLERMRAESREREREHELRLTQQREDHRLQAERDRVFYAEQRDRERREADRGLQQQQAFFNAMLRSQRDGGQGGLLQTLMLGWKLGAETSSGGGDLSEAFGKKITEGLMKGLDRLTDPDEPTARANPAPENQRKPDGAADDDGDRGGDDATLETAIRAVVENCDAAAVGAVLASLVRSGGVTRRVLKAIAAGQADAEVKERFGAEHLDKLREAADIAVRATRKPAAESAPAAGESAPT